MRLVNGASRRVISYIKGLIGPCLAFVAAFYPGLRETPRARACYTLGVMLSIPAESVNGFNVVVLFYCVYI